MGKNQNRKIAPIKWQIPVLILLGLIVALVFHLFRLSNAASYLSDKPETCVNCHVMAPQYATWKHSSHREVATCNDCHVPHDNVVKKYLFKAKDGMRHASVFSMKKEPQVIHIKDEGAHVVQQNCVHCHEDLLKDEQVLARNTDNFHYRSERKCWECHREVPHGRVNSLSSVPNAQFPLPEDPLPEWIKILLEKNE